MQEQIIIVRSHDDGEVYCVVRPADALNPQITVEEISARLPDAIIETVNVISIDNFIDYDDDMNRCEASYTFGGHEPYGTSCDLRRGHRGPHWGHDPLGNGGHIEWEGGGHCAGDPLPVRNVKHFDSH